jgi:hypothetical protein
MTEPPLYEKNAKEQYETLGRFVCAFEEMVNETRSACISIVQSMIAESTLLLHVIFNHQILTAKPLFEIMRVMIAERLKETDADDKQRATFSDVLAQLATEYSDLTNKRNNLLHGTWFIGYPTTEDENSENFIVLKYTGKKHGLGQLDLPQSVTELRDLISRCELARDWISVLRQCVPKSGHLRIEDCFKNNGKAWALRPGRKWSSPETPP